MWLFPKGELACDPKGLGVAMVTEGGGLRPGLGGAWSSILLGVTGSPQPRAKVQTRPALSPMPRASHQAGPGGGGWEVLLRL